MTVQVEVLAVYYSGSSNPVMYVNLRAGAVMQQWRWTGFLPAWEKRPVLSPADTIHDLGDSTTVGQARP